MRGCSGVPAGNPGWRCRCWQRQRSAGKGMFLHGKSFCSSNAVTGARGESSLSLLAGLNGLRGGASSCWKSAWGNFELPKPVSRAT